MRKMGGQQCNRKELAVRVGRRIEAFRREHRWSKAVLASKMEISVEWLANYERGHSLPPAYTLYQLAGVFSVSVGALLDDVPPQVPLVDDDLKATFRLVGALPAPDRVALSVFFSRVVMAFGRFKGWVIE